jgi:spore coat protein U-like protein
MMCFGDTGEFFINQNRKEIYMQRMVFWAILILVTMAWTSAFADTQTSTLNVSATGMANCRVKSVADISFGNYDPTVDTDTDAEGNFILKCTKGTVYDLYIDGTRAMTDGTDTLNYELYTDAGRNTAWPAATPGVGDTSASNADNQQMVYGRIPAAQDVGVGTYTGSVTITLNF